MNTITLFSWQEPLLEQLWQRLQAFPVVLNALPMGAGKTYLAAALIQRVKAPESWVLAPKAVLPSWQAVVGEDPSLRFLNWERLARNPGVWSPHPDALIIADEFHKFLSGRWTKSGEWLLKVASRRGPYGRIVLQSATPFSSPLAMRYSGALLGLHSGNLSDFLRWARMNGCVLVPIPHSARQRLVFPTGRKGQVILEHLYKRLSPRSVRLKLSEIPGYPSLTVGGRLLQPEGPELERLNEIDPNAHFQTYRVHLEQIRAPFVIEEARQALASGYSVLIFCSFRATHGLFTSALQEFSPAAIIGEQAEQVRQSEIQRFQQGHTRVCISTAGAGGVGINLHDVVGNAPRYVLAPLSFDIAEMVQALGRAYRVGAKSPVVIRFLALADTLESKIFQAVQRKVQNLDALIATDWSSLISSVLSQAPRKSL